VAVHWLQYRHWLCCYTSECGQCGAVSSATMRRYDIVTSQIPSVSPCCSPPSSSSSHWRFVQHARLIIAPWARRTELGLFNTLSVPTMLIDESGTNRCDKNSLNFCRRYLFENRSAAGMISEESTHLVSTERSISIVLLKSGVQPTHSCNEMCRWTSDLIRLCYNS